MNLNKNNMDFNEWWNDEKDVANLRQQIEQLLNTSCYDDEAKYSLEQQMWFYSEDELNEMKMNLLSNQRDNIDAGLNYTQTDIKRKLK